METEPIALDTVTDLPLKTQEKNTKKSFQESADFMQLDCSGLIFPVVGLC